MNAAASMIGVVVACVAAGAGQTKFASKVEAVRVDVLATANGRPVAGLQEADFEVRDNGVLQQVKLIAADTAPVNLMIALDTSSSLTSERLERLRAASLALVRKLGPEEAAGLITFSHVVTQVQPMTRELYRINTALSLVTPWGDTALVDATSLGLSLTEERTGRGLLVVFSDGVDTASWQHPGVVVRAARRFETVVYAVSVTARGRSPQFLRDIAKATSGKVLEVQSNDRLEEAFVQILDEFRQRYLLSYNPTGVTTSGWHRIEVRTKRRGVTVRARPGYFAK